MKRCILTLLIAASCMAAIGMSAGERRVMTYNVRNGIGLDGVTDFARIGRLIKSQRPMVVALQEIDSITCRSNGKDVIEAIAMAAGMKGYFAPAIDYDGGKYGIGILCRDEPLSIERYPLPGREEARTLVAAEFPEFVFACTHLSLTEEDRIASLAIIKELARKTAAKDKPLILAGDFNDTPESLFIQSLLANFRSLTSLSDPTFPADRPEELIDYIVVSRGSEGDKISAKKAEVIAEPMMSDHRPVIVNFEIAD